MKLKKFIQKVDLTKYSKITVMDEWQSTDYGDIYKGGDKINEKVLAECGDLEVIAGQNPNNLEIGGVYGNAIIKVPAEV